MSNWKEQVARILGEPTTNIMKNYYGDELADSLEVNEERLLTFYDYLRDELKFPFSANYKNKKINCLRLDHELNVDEDKGIRLVCEQFGEEMVVSLTEINVDESNKNFHAVNIFQKWIEDNHE